MDPKRPWECADMSEVRAEIHRIDSQLVELIAAQSGPWSPNQRGEANERPQATHWIGRVSSRSVK